MQRSKISSHPHPPEAVPNNDMQYNHTFASDLRRTDGNHSMKQDVQSHFDSGVNDRDHGLDDHGFHRQHGSFSHKLAVQSFERRDPHDDGTAPNSLASNQWGGFAPTLQHSFANRFQTSGEKNLAAVFNDGDDASIYHPELYSTNRTHKGVPQTKQNAGPELVRPLSVSEVMGDWLVEHNPTATISLGLDGHVRFGTVFDFVSQYPGSYVSIRDHLLKCCGLPVQGPSSTASPDATSKINGKTHMLSDNGGSPPYYEVDHNTSSQQAVSGPVADSNPTPGASNKDATPLPTAVSQLGMKAGLPLRFHNLEEARRSFASREVVEFNLEGGDDTERVERNIRSHVSTVKDALQHIAFETTVPPHPSLTVTQCSTTWANWQKTQSHVATTVLGLSDGDVTAEIRAWELVAEAIAIHRDGFRVDCNTRNKKVKCSERIALVVSMLKKYAIARVSVLDRSSIQGFVSDPERYCKKKISNLWNNTRKKVDHDALSSNLPKDQVVVQPYVEPKQDPAQRKLKEIQRRNMDVAGTKEWLKQRCHAGKDVGEVASPYGGVDATGLGAEQGPQFVTHTGAAPNHAATMTSAYSNNTSSLGHGP